MAYHNNLEGSFFSKSKSILCLILVFQVTEDAAAVLSGYEVREIY